MVRTSYVSLSPASSCMEPLIDVVSATFLYFLLLAVVVARGCTCIPDPMARILSKFAQFSGFISCICTHRISKYAIFRPKKLNVCSGEG